MIIKSLGILGGYLLHLIKARSKFDIHSPFVYNLYSKVIKDYKEYPEYIQLEKNFSGLKNKKYYLLVFRLFAWFKPSTTCFIGREKSPEKAYLHFGYPESKIIRYNGMPEGPVDMVFMDLEFITDPIIKCFSSLQQHVSTESVFIFWSVKNPGTLSDNWEAIRNLPGITITINLFRMGIVFCKKELSKEDFILRY